MPTIVAFSAENGDYIVVREDLETIKGRLALALASDSGICELTQLPKERQRHFTPARVLVNARRIAYARPPAGEHSDKAE